MKKYLICLGLRSNQLKLIYSINNKFNIIGIDRHISRKAKKLISIFFKSSLYDLDKIKNISNIIKKKKYKIKSILYRSSGPVILTANLLENIFRIKRINTNLAKSIYSKYFFYNFLKKKNILGLNTYCYLNNKKIKKTKMQVIKPDAPIYGKKNVFLYSGHKKNDFFHRCKKESHNNKVNVSDYCEGVDISSFYLIDNKINLINLISHIQEFNTFKNNKIYHFGNCTPPIYSNNLLIKYKEEIDKSIVRLYDDFYGIMSISSKITTDNKILPYEINVGLSGDKFADHMFPYIFKNKSLYKIELNINLNKTINKLINKKTNFIGFFKDKKIFSKNFFIKLTNKI